MNTIGTSKKSMNIIISAEKSFLTDIALSCLYSLTFLTSASALMVFFFGPAAECPAKLYSGKPTSFALAMVAYAESEVWKLC